MKSNEMDVELLMSEIEEPKVPKCLRIVLDCLRCFANRDYIAGQISLCT